MGEDVTDELGVLSPNFGVTTPITLKHPTLEDLESTKLVEKFLKDCNLYETEEGQRRRENILAFLQNLLCEWVDEIFVQLHNQHNSNTENIAKIFTFGSYRLGVVTPGGDIDALCLVPEYVSREAFFSSFFAKLQQERDITRLQAIPEAYTPIIKLECRNVDVDLLFARLSLPEVPPGLSTLNDDTLLKSADERTVRSLNGCRVAEDLLRLVPRKDSLITTLRFIKFWAKQRGIYSNVMGYLGGVSWALLVARVCQLYPNASPSQLIHKFFLLFSMWDWTQPILLCPIVEHRNEPGLDSFHVWNPRANHQDRYHLMPVITPSFPSMNSTHNVTLTSRKIIMAEFERGLAIVNKIRKGLLTWKNITEPFDFFHCASHYLEFLISASDTSVFNKWSGWVESKLRILVKKLEAFPNIRVRAWPYALKIDPENTWRKAVMYFAIHVDPSSPDKFVALSGPMVAFIQILISQWPINSHIGQAIDLSVKHIRQNQIPSYILEYCNKQKSCDSSSRGSEDCKNFLSHDSMNKNQSIGLEKSELDIARERARDCTELAYEADPYSSNDSKLPQNGERNSKLTNVKSSGYSALRSTPDSHTMVRASPYFEHSYHSSV